MPRGFDDLSSLSMLDLFRVEAENQTAILTSGLLELERGKAAPQLLETLMRAAHSLKGAARIVNVQSVVRVAHAMEDCFVATQERRLQLHQSEIDILLRGVDLLLKISKRPDATASTAASDDTEVAQFLASLADVLHPSHGAGEKRKKSGGASRATPESKRSKSHDPGGVADIKEAAQAATPVAPAPSVAVAPPPPVEKPAEPPAAKPVSDGAVANVGGIAWRWPNTGKLLGGFVAGDQTRQGVDIAGSAGDPVRAAADGEVVYSGNGLIGYGELIIVKHNASFLSAYGHNRKRLVQEGEKVRAGQQIAEMGSSASSRDELHFEIRKNGKPVNPMDYLPGR